MSAPSETSVGTVCISFDGFSDQSGRIRVRSELETIQKKLGFTMCIASNGDVRIPQVGFLTFMALDDALKDEGIEIEFDPEESSERNDAEQELLDRQIEALSRGIDIVHRADLIVYIDGATLYIDRNAEGISISAFMGIRLTRIQSIRIGRHRNLETGKLAVRMICSCRNGITNTVEIPSESLLRIASDHRILFDIDGEGDE